MWYWQKEDASCKMWFEKKVFDHYNRKDASDMDHKTLGDIFQEINDEFSDMNPTSLV